MDFLTQSLLAASLLLICAGLALFGWRVLKTAFQALRGKKQPPDKEKRDTRSVCV